MKVKIYMSTSDPFVFDNIGHFDVEDDEQRIRLRAQLKELLGRVRIE